MTLYQRLEHPAHGAIYTEYQSGYYYLATPYAKYPLGLEAAFQEASRQAGLLLSEGIYVFCPITHTHPIATQMAKPPSDPHRFWLDFDRPFMEAAKGLIICMMDSWEESKGIKEEIEIFSRAEKPIIHMLPNEVPKEFRK